MNKIFRRIICGTLLFIFAVGIGANPVSASESSGDYSGIDRLLKKEVKDFHIPGMAIAIVDSDEVLFSETYGNCDDSDTPFIIGSLSKSFTALAVMQLAEEQKINLDTAISDYIDPFAYFINVSDADKITVRQLLNQTSGLGTYQRFGGAEITESYGKHQYANVNYGLLGEIIEAVSGVRYSEYMDKNIFSPLNMSRTAATLTQSKENGLIKGYRNYFGFPVAGEPDYPDQHSWSTVPAGYLSSSVSDMARYLQMYLNGGEGIVSRDSINAMFYENVCADESIPCYYGMGWTLTEEYEEPVLEHAGLVENYMSNMFLLPERGLGAVFLINMNDYFVTNQLADRISENVLSVLLNKEPYAGSGNPYVVGHLLLNGAYLTLIAAAVYPVWTIGKWKKKKRTKASVFLDIVRHGIFPLLLFCLPYAVGIPIWVVWYFVKDLCIVLLISAGLLSASGIYKIVHTIIRG